MSWYDGMKFEAVNIAFPEMPHDIIDAVIIDVDYDSVFTIAIIVRAVSGNMQQGRQYVDGDAAEFLRRLFKQGIMSS